MLASGVALTFVAEWVLQQCSCKALHNRSNAIRFFSILSCNIDGVADGIACARRMVKVWAEGYGLCPEAECQDHATRWWTWPDAGLPERCTTATCADCRCRIKHAQTTCSPPTLHQPDSHGCWHDEASIAIHCTTDRTHRLRVPPALLSRY